MIEENAIAVIGYGRFGRALSVLAGRSGLEVRAFDPSADVPADLRRESPQAAAARAAYVAVAAPVSALASVLEGLRPHLAKGQVLFDVGSVKVEPTVVMGTVLGRDVAWVGTHPLFGPQSLAAGEGPLRTVVCPNSMHPGAVAQVRALYERMGCVIIEQAPDAHDRMMAETQAVAFFIARGLLAAGLVQDRPWSPPSSETLRRLVTNVAGEADHLVATIQRDNPYASVARKRLLDALVTVDQSIAHERADSWPPRPPAAGTADPATALGVVRRRIDEVDREILALLARRAQLAQWVSSAKLHLGRPVRDPDREADALHDRREWAAALDIDPAVVDQLFELIFKYSRDVQERDRSRQAHEQG